MHRMVRIFQRFTAVSPEQSLSGPGFFSMESCRSILKLPPRMLGICTCLSYSRNRPTISPNDSRYLVLLAILLEELPVLQSVIRHLERGQWVGIEFAHLMKSASSELEALIGGVLLAAAAGFLGPEAA